MEIAESTPYTTKLTSKEPVSSERAPITSAPSPQPAAAQSRTRPKSTGACSPQSCRMAARMTPSLVKADVATDIAKMPKKLLLKLSTAKSMKTLLDTMLVKRNTRFLVDMRSATMPHSGIATVIVSTMKNSTTPINDEVRPLSR
eukprot:scaffold2022_cov261-Pinguiococcus_pyrenoidosus.AAC.12